MSRTEADMSWMLLSYLKSPEGHLRYIHDLDVIAADILTAGASVFWDESLGPVAGACAVRHRRIDLSPWVFWASPSFCRRVLTEELGHIVVGVDHSRVWAWQWRRYRDLVVPVWAA